MYQYTYQFMYQYRYQYWYQYTVGTTIGTRYLPIYTKSVHKFYIVQEFCVHKY